MSQALTEKGINVTKITVALSRTIQIRQYEPLKLDLVAEATVAEGTDIRQAMDALTGELAAELNEQISAVK